MEGFHCLSEEISHETTLGSHPSIEDLDSSPTEHAGASGKGK